MKYLFIAVLTLIVSVYFCVIVIGRWHSPRSENGGYTSLPTSTQSVGYSPSVLVNGPPVLITRDGQAISATTLIEAPATLQLDEDFYELSDDPETYSIFYYKTDGTLMVGLFALPLEFTRALAERKLKEALDLSEEELCTLQIVVYTNAYVDPRYSGVNLGLSFCPGAIVLE